MVYAFVSQDFIVLDRDDKNLHVSAIVRRMLSPYFLDSLVIGNESRQNAPNAFCVGVGDVDIAESKRRCHGPKIHITLCQRDMPTPLARGVERNYIAGSAYFIVHGISPW
ncbi:hypothetical protein [Herbaspirillum autotrophicum]|uniref:hypothetical protein n=1 Tax=Herbaspirillum autotrophicum TaxID=180195 RepID=UPI0012EE206E|nr:hypothetical protein [Herbaspirillum autotrophicum]